MHLDVLLGCSIPFRCTNTCRSSLSPAASTCWCIRSARLKCFPFITCSRDPLAQMPLWMMCVCVACAVNKRWIITYSQRTVAVRSASHRHCYKPLPRHSLLPPAPRLLRPALWWHLPASRVWLLQLLHDLWPDLSLPSRYLCSLYIDIVLNLIQNVTVIWRHWWWTNTSLLLFKKLIDL